MTDGAQGSEGLTLEIDDGPDGRVVLRPVGALDIASSDRVDDAIVAAFERDPAAVRLDLRDVTFLDSSGLRGVIRAYRLASERDVGFEVVPGPPAVQRVLEVTGIARRLMFVVPGEAG
ncbi:MAG TPA: STAS domain-containing protein [Actinomycetota bacterium]